MHYSVDSTNRIPLFAGGRHYRMLEFARGTARKTHETRGRIFPKGNVQGSGNRIQKCRQGRTEGFIPPAEAGEGSPGSQEHQYRVRGTPESGGAGPGQFRGPGKTRVDIRCRWKDRRGFPGSGQPGEEPAGGPARVHPEVRAGGEGGKGRRRNRPVAESGGSC